MYMPMNSVMFRNDNYSEVLGVFLPLVMYSLVNLPTRHMNMFSNSNELEVTDVLRRLGMRKSVELAVEYILLGIYGLALMPIVTYSSVTFLLRTTDFWFFFWNLFAYGINVILLNHLIKFAIDDHHLHEVVDITVEVTSILAAIVSHVLTKIYPLYIYISSFLLPLPGISNCILLGTIAFNKD